MNAFSKREMLANATRIRQAMAKLRAPALLPEVRGLPELPAMLKTMVTRLGDLGGAAADLPLPAKVPPANTPPGARFETRTYSGPAGRLDYKLFIPSGYDGTPAPLVVMLHGCTQSPDDFAAGTRMNVLAEAGTILVAYPAQPRAANMQKCWNWFDTQNQQRDSGEAAVIAGLTRQIMQDFSVQPGRVFVAGLSAGGALAAIMGATYPDLYAATGVHSGLACGAAHNMQSAFTAMKSGAAAPPAAGRVAPSIVFHGDQDGTVSIGNAEQVAAQVRAGARLRAEAADGEAGGRRYTRTIERAADGATVLERWVLHGAGHAWSGGDAAGSYTDPKGPDASREMLRFFLEQPV